MDSIRIKTAGDKSMKAPIVFMEKVAVSYNRIMGAVADRATRAANAMKEAKPEYAGYIANKTNHQLYRMGNQLKGRLGERGLEKVMDMKSSLPPTARYKQKMYEGITSALKAGKPEAAGKALATQARGNTGGIGSIQSAKSRFMRLKPNEMGSTIDGTAQSARDVFNNIPVSNSMLHT